MIFQRVLFIASLLLTMGFQQLYSQQIPDTSYAPPFFAPRYTQSKGSIVMIDEAHNNFHTAENRYLPFARLLEKDGYRISRGRDTFRLEQLRSTRILVIANALHRDNVQRWSLPVLPAFSPAEITALQTWVQEGGSLLLIADHMPFPGAAANLAQAFGFRFYNGFAFDTVSKSTPDMFSKTNGRLGNHEIIRGATANEGVDSIATFTGQAFDIPANATALLRLDSSFTIYLCEVAWNFKEKTTIIEGTGKAQAAVMQYGKGRIAVIGEAAMFTAQISGVTRTGMNTEKGARNYRFLLNILHWLDT